MKIPEPEGERESRGGGDDLHRSMPHRHILQRLFSLEGKVALVTGASGGIGRALACAVAEAGASVALSGRDEARLLETAETVERAHEAHAAAGIGSGVRVGEQTESESGRYPRSTCIAGEISAPQECRSLVEETVRRLGGLDILIHCAGMNRRKPAMEVTPDDFDSIMAVNLRSAFFLSQAAQPHLAAAGGGKIIHVGSLTSSQGLGTVSVYGASKGGLAQLVKTLAVEWARHNIQVNCLAPGFMLTPLTEKPLWGDPRKRTWLEGRIPAKRPGLPDELVGACLLLASPASSYLTGQLITVDGGVLAGGSWEEA